MFIATSVSPSSSVSRKTSRLFSVAVFGFGGIFGFSFRVVNARTVGIWLEWLSSVDTDPSLDLVDVKVFGTVYMWRRAALLLCAVLLGDVWLMMCSERARLNMAASSCGSCKRRN